MMEVIPERSTGARQMPFVDLVREIPPKLLNSWVSSSATECFQGIEVDGVHFDCSILASIGHLGGEAIWAVKLI